MSSGYNKLFMEQKDRFLENHFLIFTKNQDLSDKGVYEFDIANARDKINQCRGKTNEGRRDPAFLVAAG